jgi:hypothetical protein
MLFLASSSCRRKSFWVLVSLWAGAACLAGCSRGPQAPVLSDESVYQNNREGFRFDVPNGWTQIARGEIPPGTVEKERMLVEYKLLPGPNPAGLQVTCIDLSPQTNPEAYLAERMKTLGDWQKKGRGEKLSIHGRDAVRLQYLLKPFPSDFAKKMGTKAPKPEADDLREIVVFRRNERVYFFTAMLPSSDKKALGDIRRAIETIEWKS